MNSLILSALYSFFSWLGGLWKNSGIYSVLMRIYNGFSTSWKNSRIMTKLRGEKTDGASVSSVTGKIGFSVFGFLTFVKKKIGGFLKENIAVSFICEWAKVFEHNFMALNTRFFGVMLVCASIAYCVMGAHVSKIALIAGAVGAIACIFNFNVMDFLNPSKVVSFVKSSAGFEDLSFDFFDAGRTKGKLRLVFAVAIGLLAGAVMHYNMLYGAAVPFLVFFVLLVMYVPVTGVFLAVFAAPFVPTMALAALCVWTGLALVIKSFTDEDFKWRFDGVGLCIIVFLGVLLLSSVMSFARMGSLKVWAMYLVFVGFYFIVINSVKTKEQLRGLLKLFIISGALVALYGIMQYAFGWTTTNAWIDEEMFEEATMRVYSTLGNPNVLGEYLLLVLPVAAVYVLKPKWKEISKYAYAAMFLCLALCLVLTQSRGCWIGFMVSVVIFVTFYEGKLWGLVPLVLLIVPFILPQTIVERFMSVGNMEDTSTSYRVFIWLGTLGMMKYYWLGGIGMGEAAFSKVYPFFSYNAIIAPHSHNTFLQLLVEAGIGGLLSFLALQVVFIKKMTVVYRADDKKSENSMIALALICAVVGFLVQSMFDYTFYNYRVMAIFFMVLAIGMALRHITVPYKGGDNNA